MSRTWRLLRTPRWIALTVVAVLAVGAFVAASVWQYQRTQDQLTVARAALAHPAAYEDIVPADAQEVPLDALGRQVVVSGDLVPGTRSYIRSRLSPSGEAGFWVVDGVRLSDGRLVAVLQGWVAGPRGADEAVPATPGADDRGSRQAELLGRLQPDENFYATAPKPASGPLLTITRSGLAGQWPRGVAARGFGPGYVTALDAAVPGVEPVRPVIGTDPDVAFPLQNAFYSLQWLIFAGVVIFVWVRWLREEAHEEGGSDSSARVSGDPGDRVSLER